MLKRSSLFMLGVALCISGTGSTLAVDLAKPNIILVMSDDQGWGDTGYNGHPFVKTPATDAMAEDAFVFDRFYAGAPVCSPTRASVMTGRNPIRTKVTNHGRYMRPQERTIAESLKAAGYATGIFGKLPARPTNTAARPSSKPGPIEALNAQAKASVVRSVIPHKGA